MNVEFGSIGARVVLAGAILLGGCEAPQATPNPDHVIVQESAPPQLPKVEEPGGVCVKFTPDLYTQDQIRQQAETCRQAMGKSAVAFVVFKGLSKTEPEIAQAADEIESLVSEASGKLLNVEVDVVPASAEAEEWQKKVSEGRSCIDVYKQPPPSVVADRTMAELREKYHFVVAVGPWRNCASLTEGGRAPLEGRHADVWGEKLDNKRDGAKASMLGFVAAHELFHSLGLGHEGDIFIEEGTYEAFGGVVDVRSLLAKATYYEFGRGGSVMSDNHSTDYILTNPIHLDHLRWPLQVLDGKPSAATAITEAGLAISHKGYEGQFFTLDLSEPILLGSSDKKFTKAALVPSVYGRDGFGTLNLCLVSEQNDIVWISNYYKNPQQKKMVFDFGGQKIEAELTPAKVGARTVSQ